jgi:hypothetical protein
MLSLDHFFAVSIMVIHYLDIEDKSGLILIDAT